MKAITTWLEATFSAVPLPLLEVWGRLAYLIGFALAIYAYAGFTFRLGSGWGFGRERQAWDAKAILCVPLTFVLVTASGYLGSFVVLVPGAQTFESLKDLVVFLCIVLFGYPALLTVPFAYGLSDLIEGVPPNFLLDWLPGYFINPTCFWLAYQLFGKDANFARADTWKKYFLFVPLFTVLEPVLWGYICSDKFTSEISYRSITPALLFTTSVTWLLAPPAMLLALPLARRFGLYWPEIDGHVKERALGKSVWIWQASGTKRDSDPAVGDQGLPIRIFILAPFIALVLVLVGATAYVTLRSAEADADKLARRLHQEAATNIKLRLDDHFAALPPSATDDIAGINALLNSLPLAVYGHAFIVDPSGATIAMSHEHDAVIVSATEALREQLRGKPPLWASLAFRFDHVTARPLSRETWLCYATPYRARGGQDWILTTVIPEAYYLAGVRKGNSRSAMIFALSLLLSLAMAAVLASKVTSPLRQLAKATRSLSNGDLSARVPLSRLDELGALGQSFNDMAGWLAKSFEEVRASEARLEDLVRQRTLALQRSEKRTQGILDNLVDGVITIDGSGVILSMSPAACKMFGYGSDEMIGRNVSKLMPEPDASRHDGYVRSYLETGVARIIGTRRELTGQRGNGARFPLDLAVAEVSIGDERLFAGVVRDISERIQVERALHEAKDAADAANRAKTTFLANMSHEIRTPMNAILGFGQLMAREAELGQRDRDRVGKILSSGYHLLAVINNVLEMAKIEAGRTELANVSFDLCAALADVEAIVRDSMEAKGLSFDSEGVDTLPRYVRADVAKLRQILVNLLNNAGKFTRHGGVRLRAEAKITGENVALRFDVVDTGAGIAEDELGRLFEPFEQTQSGLEARTGSGLGLAISRDLARLMGGELRVSSVVGKGTCFSLELPATLAAGADVPATLPPPGTVVVVPAGQRAPVVLVVDDEPDNRTLLRELLVGAGMTVFEAADGAEAVARFDSHGADFVLMDVKMPGVDGVEATRRIRAMERGKHVPVVLLSASVFRDDTARVLETGGNEFIAKPFRESQIWEAMERHLGIELVRATRPRPEAPSPGPTRADVAALGDTVLAAVRDAVDSGYVQNVPALLAGVAPEHAHVATALSELARNLEIQKLLELL